MKRNRLLNANLSHAIASMGHGDLMIVCDAGFPIPSDGYLPGVKKLCEQHGALYVADEVQTGLGRTGSLWGVESFGVEPDVLITGKGLYKPEA